jgi:hypothetical protein
MDKRVVGDRQRERFGPKHRGSCTRIRRSPRDPEEGSSRRVLDNPANVDSPATAQPPENDSSPIASSLFKSPNSYVPVVSTCHWGNINRPLVVSDFGILGALWS